MNRKKFMLGAVMVSAISVLALVGCSKHDANQTTPLSTGMNTTNFTTNATGTIKEFAMQSYSNMVNGKPAPRYSLQEMTVKKWDIVKVKITVTKGMHNFNIDEFNVHFATPINQETVVEFVADKVWKFIYYCSMPGHRANGHWGTLTVTE